MSNERKVTLQPAYVLHHKPYRDTSLLLEVFSRGHGRVGMVARGARGRRSAFKALLQPFYPVLLSWSGRGELQTLTAAEPNGTPHSLVGDALLSGFYLNELLMRLLHRHDPHTSLYLRYEQTVAQLAQHGQAEWLLRCFERDLLQELGYGLQLTQTDEGLPLEPEQLYCYRLEQGAGLTHDDEGMGLRIHGATLLQLDSGAEPNAQIRREAKQLMRAALQSHLGNKPLASRELFRARYANRQLNQREE